MNSVNVTGRLVDDPKLGKAGEHDVAELRLAVNRGDKAVFINVKAFDREGRNAAEYLTKGSLVGVTGRIQQDQWETSEGESRHSAHYIVAERIDYLETRMAAAARGASVDAVGI